jgi:hypothetical protein
VSSSSADTNARAHEEGLSEIAAALIVAADR